MPAILLAVDGSDYARAAADRAIDLAVERGADLHVLCVVDQRKFDEPALGSSELATMEAENHSHECVSEVAALADATDVTVSGDTRHGIPHELILEYADQVDADTIVVGAHGDHAEHFGGVGRKVIERADCEVVVVE